jgi:S1-C subfamily serine protease
MMKFGADLLLVDHVIAREFNLIASNGMLVDMVFKGSPANKGGLVRGDVILSINGQPISSLSQFRNILWDNEGVDSIALSIFRKGKVKDIKVKF